MRSRLRQASKAVFAGLDMLVHPADGPRVLIYHQIGGGSGLEMEVEVDTFQWQLDWLSDNCRVVDLEGALSRPDERGVVLTFDDGYQSVHDLAFPLLVERRLPFTLYVTTDPIETGRPLREHPGSNPLSWEQIKSMMGTGLLTIGAHTHTHPDFRVIGAEAVERELSISNELLDRRLGVTPRHFAYPWGYWSEAADPHVRVRFATAALGSRLPRERWRYDSHLIHRVPVQASDGTRWFKKRIESGLVFEESVRRRLRGYEGP